jgi:hypothetical protein
MFNSNQNFDPNISGFFALECAYNFLRDGDIGDNRFEENLNISIIFNNIINLDNSIDFHNLISFSNIKNIPTYYSSFMMEENIIDYNALFPLDYIKNKAAFIIKQQHTFYVILVNLNSQYKFAIRNSMKNIQYNFLSFDDLLIYLFNEYSFHNFDEILILSIYKKFDCDINKLTGIDLKSNYTIIENKKGYIEIDNTILNYNSDGDDSIFD